MKHLASTVLFFLVQRLELLGGVNGATNSLWNKHFGRSNSTSRMKEESKADRASRDSQKLLKSRSFKIERPPDEEVLRPAQENINLLPKGELSDQDALPPRKSRSRIFFSLFRKSRKTKEAVPSLEPHIRPNDAGALLQGEAPRSTVAKTSDEDFIRRAPEGQDELLQFSEEQSNIAPSVQKGPQELETEHQQQQLAHVDEATNDRRVHSRKTSEQEENSSFIIPSVPSTGGQDEPGASSRNPSSKKQSKPLQDLSKHPTLRGSSPQYKRRYPVFIQTLPFIREESRSSRRTVGRLPDVDEVSNVKSGAPCEYGVIQPGTRPVPRRTTSSSAATPGFPPAGPTPFPNAGNAASPFFTLPRGRSRRPQPSYRGMPVFSNIPPGGVRHVGTDGAVEGGPAYYYDVPPPGVRPVDRLASDEISSNRYPQYTPQYKQFPFAGVITSADPRNTGPSFFYIPSNWTQRGYDSNAAAREMVALYDIPQPGIRPVGAEDTVETGPAFQYDSPPSDVRLVLHHAAGDGGISADRSPQYLRPHGQFPFPGAFRSANTGKMEPVFFYVPSNWMHRGQHSNAPGLAMPASYDVPQPRIQPVALRGGVETGPAYHYDVPRPGIWPVEHPPPSSKTATTSANNKNVDSSSASVAINQASQDRSRVLHDGRGSLDVRQPMGMTLVDESGEWYYYDVPPPDIRPVKRHPYSSNATTSSDSQGYAKLASASGATITSSGHSVAADERSHTNQYVRWENGKLHLIRRGQDDAST